MRCTSLPTSLRNLGTFWIWTLGSLFNGSRDLRVLSLPAQPLARAPKSSCFIYFDFVGSVNVLCRNCWRNHEISTVRKQRKTRICNFVRAAIIAFLLSGMRKVEANINESANQSKNSVPEMIRHSLSWGNATLGSHIWSTLTYCNEPIMVNCIIKEKLESFRPPSFNYYYQDPDPDRRTS